jgi:membrane-bound serine protease (ClpP class)
MIGEVGVAVSDVQPEGKVLVHGEYWNASSADPIAAGAKVRVINVHGLKVQVEADKESL